MRNILARHSAMALALAIVVAMPLAAAAADLFWYGTAGDGLWNTPANWSTTEGSYTASAAYPNDEMTYIVHLYTHLVAGHAIDITIPANCTDAACRRIRVKDNSAPGSVSITGGGDSRVPLLLSTYPNNNYNGGFVRTGTTYPVKITCRNIYFSKWLYFNWSGQDTPDYWSQTVADGDGFALYNCCYTNYPNETHAQINPPGGVNATCAIVDSDIDLRYFVRANPNGALTIAITNSTLSVNERMRIDGPGTTLDFVGSTLKIGTATSTDPKLLFGSRTDSESERNANAGMSIRFKDSTIDFTDNAIANCGIYTRSAGRELAFDNCEIKGDLYAIQTPDEDCVTRVKDTSLHFKRGNGSANGTRGTFYLDNGEWVMDTGHIELSNGKAHFIFSGAAPCLDPGYFKQSGNDNSPTFDFIVPAGGYAYPPISRRYSSDTSGGIFGDIPNASPYQAKINVLPESKSAKTAGTTICPLVYVKNTNMSVHLGRGVPTTLPNEKSSFLYTTDGTWEYDAVTGKAESDWTAWDGTAAAAGLAVKIVGSPSGLAIFVR